jgi:lysophospholipase L1-like esterase
VRSLAAGVLALAVLGATGCGGGDPKVERYVALGDSYTAGTGAGTLVEGPPGAGCGQIRSSYPRLVAQELDAHLTDASCAGAQTAHATTAQITDGGEWPPQLDSVSTNADLVTVGLGYNDLGFFLLLTFGCAGTAASDPTGTPCRDQNRAKGVDAGAMADQIGDHLRDLLEQIHRRAPHARVLLVGYPQLVPDEGTCSQLPLAAGDYAYVRDQFAHLDDAMRGAASDAGATFVEVYEASKGHDICAGDDAWVNGATATGRAVQYHPFATGLRAVADLVVDAVRD